MAGDGFPAGAPRGGGVPLLPLPAGDGFPTGAPRGGGVPLLPAPAGDGFPAGAPRGGGEALLVEGIAIRLGLAPLGVRALTGGGNSVPLLGPFVCVGTPPGPPGSPRGEAGDIPVAKVACMCEDGFDWN